MISGASLVHALQCLAGVDQPHSQTTERERAAFAKWATGRRRAAEIGVYEGLTNRVIAEVLADDGYFASHIRHDPRFELLEQVYSRSALRRGASGKSAQSEVRTGQESTR